MKNITGSWQNLDGTPVAGGRVFLRLSQDAVALNTTQVSSALISFNLDANGSIVANSQFWANDELSPSGTSYSVSVIAAGGGLVWGAENLALVGASPISINTAIPSGSSGVTTPGAVLLNPVGGANQTVNGPLTIVGTTTTSEFSNTGFTIFKGDPYFDVRAFGALCDGITDDTTAIQAALTAANTLGGLVTIPEGKTCVVASSAATALNLDHFINVGITGGIPSQRSRPGGGTTQSAKIKFTGSPTVAVSAKSSFGVALSNIIFEATNAAFNGTVIDTSHNGVLDTEGFHAKNLTLSVVSSSCNIIISLDKTIQSTVEDCHFFGGVIQVQGAVAAGSYSNIIDIVDCDFNGSSTVTTFINNPGEAWSIKDNTFEVNGASVVTLGNSGGFVDTVALDFSGNWDGDDTGAGAFTKYVLPAGTAANFESSFISATHNNVNGFSIGNNSKITLSGGMDFASGSVFGTMFTLGTGVSLNVNPALYATVTSFMSGTPATGTVTHTTGNTYNFGGFLFNIPTTLNPLASVHARASVANSAGLPATISSSAVIGDTAFDTSGGGGTSKTYGVIGTARSLNALAGDKSYGGWFKAIGFSAAAEEVGVHAETSDAASTATIFEGQANGVDKYKINSLGIVSNYGGIATVGNGVAAEYSTTDLTAQTAAIAATTIYAVPASAGGLYRVSWYAKVTTAATTSCVLGGTNGYQLVYTDNTDSVVVTTPAWWEGGNNGTAPTAATVNTTQNVIQGVYVVNAKASTNLQHSIGYTSVGVTPMAYELHVIVEKL